MSRAKQASLLTCYGIHVEYKQPGATHFFQALLKQQTRLANRKLPNTAGLRYKDEIKRLVGRLWVVAPLLHSLPNWKGGFSLEIGKPGGLSTCIRNFFAKNINKTSTTGFLKYGNRESSWSEFFPGF